jgi:integrase
VAQIQQRVGRNGRISWRVRVRLRGRPAQTETFAKKTDAVLWAKRMEEDVRSGRAVFGTEARRRTFQDLTSYYRAEVMPQYEPPEQMRREHKLRWWEGQLGHAWLADITPPAITACKAALAKIERPGGKTLSPATQVRYLATLSHVFSIAVRDLGWLEVNPVTRVRRPREPRGRVRYLSDDERSRLLAACQASSDSRLYPLVVVALGTGARQGELLRLRWRDVDFQRGVAILQETKNGERRTLVLAGQVLKVLRELAAVRRIDTDELFATGRARAMTFPQHAWNDAVSAAGLEDFRFHDLRHTFASYLAMNGATLPELAAALGHKTLAMVQRYAHLSPQHTSNVVTRMVERVLG